MNSFQNTGKSLAVILFGLLVAGFSASADYLGLDLTPGVGLFQITGILAGITTATAASFYLIRRHQIKTQLSLISDVGFRMGLTGLLACFVAGMADLLGVGTHRSVRFEQPFFGPLQMIGFIVGLFAIVAGLLLFWIGFKYKTGDEKTDH